MCTHAPRGSSEPVSSNFDTQQQQSPALLLAAAAASTFGAAFSLRDEQAEAAAAAAAAAACFALNELCPVFMPLCWYRSWLTSISFLRFALRDASRQSLCV